jgi:hypothetical protein
MENAKADPAQCYPHLNPSVAQIADQGADVRLAYLKEDRFIPYKAARSVMDELTEVLSWPNSVRPPCRMVLGESDMGKSAIFKVFENDHPALDNIDGEAALVPVLRMQFPETGSDGVYGEIIRKLNAQTTSNPSPRALRSQALSLLDSVKNLVLIIDEVANVITKDLKRQTIAMNAIKFITNEMERPIVLGVTPDAFAVVSKDRHLRTRFEPVFLPRFKDETDDDGNSDFRDFLYGFELALPLRKPSNLMTNNDIAYEIMIRTFGITGAISKLLVACAREAIKSGEECITVEAVKRVVWMDRATVSKKLGEL